MFNLEDSMVFKMHTVWLENIEPWKLVKGRSLHVFVI